MSLPFLFSKTHTLIIQYPAYDIDQLQIVKVENMSYIATRAEIDGLFNLCGEVVDIKVFKEKSVLLLHTTVFWKACPCC